MHTNPCADDAYRRSFWALIQRGVKLERDDDYMRALLMRFETSGEWTHLSVAPDPDDADELKEHYHILLLVDAGMMASVPPSFASYRITNMGHDFLALTRRNEAWEATKKVAGNLGGATFQMLLRVAEGLARQKLAELGVPIGQ